MKATTKHRARRRGERGGITRVAIALLALLVVIGVVVYVVVGAPPGRSAAGAGSDVRNAVGVVRDVSQNAVLTSKVKAALALSKNVSAFDIHVQSDEGVVTLSGQVPTVQNKKMAEEITMETSGVRAVRNDLKVDPTTKPDPEIQRLSNRVADLELQSRVSERLNASGLANQIDVSVADGVVTLGGAVSRSEDKYAAEQLVRGMDEVRGVRNDIQVKAEAGARPEGKDELSGRVEFELYSAHAFDLEAVHVRSSNGVVVLDGHVRSAAERLLAERIAKDTQGVKGVRNDLIVQSPDAQKRRAPADQG
jgi:hyperosmotically inducible protein